MVMNIVCLYQHITFNSPTLLIDDWAASKWHLENVSKIISKYVNCTTQCFFCSRMESPSYFYGITYQTQKVTKLTSHILGLFTWSGLVMYFYWIISRPASQKFLSDYDFETYHGGGFFYPYLWTLLPSADLPSWNPPPVPIPSLLHFLTCIR